MEAGTEIARLRKAHGWTQEALADRLFVSKDLVSKWETGKRRPDYGTVERIADLFGVPADSILGKEQFVLDELSGCLPDGDGMTEDGLTALLERFLRSLPRADAELFALRYYFLESYPAIAEKKGMGENHVRSRLSKIRKKLIRFAGRKE